LLYRPSHASVGAHVSASADLAPAERSYDGIDVTAMPADGVGGAIACGHLVENSKVGTAVGSLPRAQVGCFRLGQSWFAEVGNTRLWPGGGDAVAPPFNFTTYAIALTALEGRRKGQSGASSRLVGPTLRLAFGLIQGIGLGHQLVPEFLESR
jgi:hypothetical protein